MTKYLIGQQNIKANFITFTKQNNVEWRQKKWLKAQEKGFSKTESQFKLTKQHHFPNPTIKMDTFQNF